MSETVRTAHQEDAEVVEAVATAIGDQTRLLEGEDPETTDLEAIRRWASIYAELLAFKHDLAARMRAEHERLPEAAKNEVSLDLELIERQMDRLKRRLGFWRSRQLRMGGMLESPASLDLAFGEKSVRLSRREAQLFSFLSRNAEKGVATAVLAAAAWHDSALSAAQVRNYVSRLRQKLDFVGAPCRIETLDGRGYRLAWGDSEKT
jgi:DNA-binding response OmpR family regulator